MQNYNENDGIAIKGGPLHRYSFDDLCPGATLPNTTVSMFEHNQDNNFQFELSPCTSKLKSWKHVAFKFVGTFEVQTEAQYDYPCSKIRGKFPKVWGVNEPVKVMLVLDHVAMDTGLTVEFVSPQQESSVSQITLTVEKTESTVELTWSDLPTSDGQTYDLERIEVTANGKCNYNPILKINSQLLLLLQRIFQPCFEKLHFFSKLVVFYCSDHLILFRPYT